MSNEDKDLCPALLENEERRGYGTGRCGWTGQLSLPPRSPHAWVHLGQCPRTRTLYSLLEAWVWGQVGSWACGSRRAGVLSLGAPRGPLSAWDVRPTGFLSPCPHAPHRPAALGEQTGPIRRPSLQFLGMGCALQLSFPGAGAKQAAPRWLAGLQAFCAERFSAAAGRPTSLGLEETQQLASVCFSQAIKRVHNSAPNAHWDQLGGQAWSASLPMPN